MQSQQVVVFLTASTTPHTPQTFQSSPFPPVTLVFSHLITFLPPFLLSFFLSLSFLFSLHSSSVLSLSLLPFLPSISLSLSLPSFLSIYLTNQHLVNAQGKHFIRPKYLLTNNYNNTTSRDYCKFLYP